MKVYLVRHAQSSNNILCKSLREQLGNPPPGSAAEEQLTREFEKRRSDNAELSAVGRQQCALLASYFDHYLSSTPTSPSSSSHPIQLWSSPMRRAIETSLFLRESIPLSGNGKVVIRPDIYEVGGSYKDKEGVCIPVEGWNAYDFEHHHPRTLQVPSGLEDKGWYAAPHKETPEEAARRVARVTDALWELVEGGGGQGGTRSPAGSNVSSSSRTVVTSPPQSPPVAVPHGLEALSPNASSSPPPPAAIVLVCHGDFISYLLRHLLGIKDSSIRFSSCNTGVSLITLTSDKDRSSTTSPSSTPPSRDKTRHVNIDYLNKTDHFYKHPELYT